MCASTNPTTRFFKNHCLRAPVFIYRNRESPLTKTDQMLGVTLTTAYEYCNKHGVKLKRQKHVVSADEAFGASV